MTWTPISKAYVFLKLSAEPTPVGIIRLHNAQFEFNYAKSWLERENAFPLDPLHLPLQEQPFFSDRMFDSLMDATPDNWGKRVLATLHKQLPQNEIEWLLASRSGGVGATVFTASRDHQLTPLRIPDFDDLVSLAEASSEIDARDLVPDERILKLMWHGSSMGGARPKSTVTYEGQEWIAKFTKYSDIFDESRAEYASLAMAKDAGILVPETRLIELPEHTVILVKRFDRSPDQQRKHYISAHAMVGMSRIRPEDLYNRYSYSGIAESIRKVSNRATADLHQLFRRMVFNVAISNTDDHLRNHGFLYQPDEGFRLSPAFDILPHPTQSELHAIGIGREGRKSSLDNAISRADQFLLSNQDAREIVDQVRDITLNSRRYFAEAGMGQTDSNLLTRVCNKPSPTQQRKSSKLMSNDPSP